MRKIVKYYELLYPDKMHFGPQPDDLDSLKQWKMNMKRVSQEVFKDAVDLMFEKGIIQKIEQAQKFTPLESNLKILLEQLNLLQE